MIDNNRQHSAKERKKAVSTYTSVWTGKKDHGNLRRGGRTDTGNTDVLPAAEQAGHVITGYNTLPRGDKTQPTVVSPWKA